MSSFDITKILVSEDNYSAIMKEEILPYINERKTQLFLSRNEGQALYVLSYAPENAKGAIVISHGFTETTAKFAEMIYYFLNAGLAVYVYDHCGHGKSYRIIDDPDKVQIDTYKRYANDLLFVAHAAKDAYPDIPLYLYGHSMGGGIAAAAASLEPDLFSKVALSSPMIRPATGNFPWFVTRIICWLFAHIGKGEDYAPGQKPYTGEENFENCYSNSRSRFDYYNEIRKSDKDLQMNGATYGWLFACVKMNIFLQKKGWKQFKSPVLLFQAENEELVINSQQQLFIDKLKRCGVSAELIQIKNTKHEIYRAQNDVLEVYLNKLFDFLLG